MYGFSGKWSQFNYTLKEPNTYTNGVTTSTIYVDDSGTYVDADYNLGKIEVFTTTGASVSVRNTKDTYTITEDNKKYELKAQIENVKAYTEGYDAIYRTAKLTIWKKEAGAADSTYVNITDQVKFGISDDKREVPTDDNSIIVFQKISKTPSTDSVDGIKYAKDVTTYFITDKDGSAESVLGIDHPYNPSGISTNVDGIVSYYYDSDNKEFHAEAINLKTDHGYNYLDLGNSDKVDADAWANGGGQVYAVGNGYIYKWDGKENLQKIYRVDGSMSNIAVSDKDNIVVWDKDKEVYSIISNKAAVTEEKDTAANTTTGTAVNVTTSTATGWIKDNSGSWSYNNEDGTKKTGWLNDLGIWYYLKSDGALATGWLNISGNWYCLNTNGAMLTGWINDNGGWYYCDASGAMLSNTIVDGYTLNNSGEWIK